MVAESTGLVVDEAAAEDPEFEVVVPSVEEEEGVVPAAAAVVLKPATGGISLVASGCTPAVEGTDALL